MEHDWWTKRQFSSIDFTFIVQHTVQKVKTSGFCDYQIMLWTSSIIITFIISTNEISCENDVGPLLLVVIKLASKTSVCDHNILCNKWQIFVNRSSKVSWLIFGTINTFIINRLPASSTILAITTARKQRICICTQSNVILRNIRVETLQLFSQYKVFTAFQSLCKQHPSFSNQINVCLSTNALYTIFNISGSAISTLLQM